MIRRPPRSTLFPYTNALPIYSAARGQLEDRVADVRGQIGRRHRDRSEEHTSELQSPYDLVCRLLLEKKKSTPPSSLLQPTPTRPHRGLPERRHSRTPRPPSST